MTRPYKKEAIAELPRATKRDLLRNKVVDIDAKFSKAISDILCSIGELRARIEENAAEYSKLKQTCNEYFDVIDSNTINKRNIEEYQQQTDGYLNGHDMKIQALEAQVKKLFSTKEDKPYTLKLSNSPETRIKTLVLKLQDAIKEYNRG